MKNCSRSGCSADRWLHRILSFEGGFLGAYAVASRAGIFASAQTGNLMSAMECLYKGEGEALLFRIGFAVVFSGALVLSYILKVYAGKDLRGCCMFTDAAALLIMSLIPETVNPIVAVYPLAFAASFQWGTFSGSDGYNSSTIFITNNLEQCVWGFTEYIHSGNGAAREKGIYYGITLILFLAGAWLGYASVGLAGIKGGLIGLIPLGAAEYILKR